MRNKSTILIVGPTPPPMGGIATYVEDMLKSRISEEYDVLHLNTSRSFSIKKSLMMNLSLFCSNLLRLVYLLLIHRPQIVHIHTSSYLSFWEKSIFLIVSKLFSRKIVLHVHGAKFDSFYKNNGMINKFLIRKIFRYCDNVVVLSLKWKNFFLSLVDQNKISVIPNGIEYTKFESFEKSFPKISNGKIQILFLGNLTQRKGIYDILEVVPKIKDKFIDVNFVFAGSEEFPGDLNRFKKECVAKEINNSIKLIFNFSDNEKMKLFFESDIYLLPSYAEGLPISLLEAMAAGLPVISTPVGGIPEVIEEGVNGFIISPGDTDDLANKICKLVEDKDLREMMGEKNQLTIKQMYDWLIVSKKISSMYYSIVAGNPAKVIRKRFED